MAVYTTITNLEFHAAIMEDAASLGATNWTINKNARPGDLVILYVCSPISSVVATAIVSDKPYLEEDLNSEWYGKYFADMSDLTMLLEPIRRTDLLEMFPDWKYWTQPRNSIEIKAEYVSRLENLIGGK